MVMFKEVVWQEIDRREKNKDKKRISMVKESNARGKQCTLSFNFWFFVVCDCVHVCMCMCMQATHTFRLFFGLWFFVLCVCVCRYKLSLLRVKYATCVF